MRHSDHARTLLPDWHTQAWLNCDVPPSLPSLRGKVVAIFAFQMLCPGCVLHSLPQAQRVRDSFPENDVAVIGLHTVFEHHDVATVAALRAFVSEYRWTFPIGVDEPQGDAGIPRTMQAYGLQGTPSLVLVDREGGVRLHHFGHLDDLVMGKLLGRLTAESAATERLTVDADTLDTRSSPPEATCSPAGCEVPQRDPQT